jgi:hypothetical protein
LFTGSASRAPRGSVRKLTIIRTQNTPNQVAVAWLLRVTRR